MIEAILFSKRIILPTSLLLMIVLIDKIVLHSSFPELDLVEHFLFGFALSEFLSESSNALGFEKRVARRLNKASKRADLFIRLTGFLFIGGLLWEGSERFIFPMFGVMYNPFFSFPVTLHNVDGAIDVTIGVIGCMIAWYTKKS